MLFIPLYRIFIKLSILYEGTWQINVNLEHPTVRRCCYKNTVQLLLLLLVLMLLLQQWMMFLLVSLTIFNLIAFTFLPSICLAALIGLLPNREGWRWSGEKAEKIVSFVEYFCCYCFAISVENLLICFGNLIVVAVQV